MRLHHVVLVVVAAIVAGSNASPDSEGISKIDPVVDSHILTGEQNGDDTKRFLRAEQEMISNDEQEERRLGNAQDAWAALRKATKWKAQFAAWKLVNKTPAKYAEELGGFMGIGHRKWEKFMAYQKYYGKGPLKYP
ncbi:hypothetical protein PF005_g28005 [Phytophthora fragariae]|uniref:RxLR effector protein n=1 Tax=Phytophthora fragariae TaxID=53985 RepID=A0A6A3I7G6_9STRA|nr:hypothetical protein PF003_g16239 [Phytophthora fragariae]KAE8922480.1 hypothetical protein PF009_g27260 [Phytophthora fragariae]KAE8978170.1 hypothetical protein PF011_g23353 [Phytophthora fragariae]KAE9070826.1 hypothetical protein PF010_g26116 [Phytophthora fragariae]KAE9071393.1 hypothetical protein PF007_g26577 [Phytophthora fragariae]